MSVLRDAAETIQRGWTKKTEYKRGANQYASWDAFCAIGALKYVCGMQVAGRYDWGSRIRHETDEFQKAQRSLVEVIHEQYPEITNPDSVGAIVSFNDFKGRKKDEVIAVFEKAAVRYEEME